MGQTEHINIKEIVTKGSIFGTIMCCATMSKVNNIGNQYSIKKMVHFLTSIWLPHSQLWAILRGSLTHPLLITEFLHFLHEGHREPHNKVGSLSPAENLVSFEPSSFRFSLQCLNHF